jgi:peptidoglycan/LPS O-acetylase OafA/YrhL
MDRSSLDPTPNASITHAAAAGRSVSFAHAPTSSGAVSPDQWAILALLRFFLASVVVVGHCFSYAGNVHDWINMTIALNPGSAVFGFLILSGFSISASLEREPSHYYFRRFARIWPLYICALGVGLAMAWQFPNGVPWRRGQVWLPATPSKIIASILMLQGFLALPIPIIGQIWSLSVEWWHYMLAPFLKKAPSFFLIYMCLVSLSMYVLKISLPGYRPETLQFGLAFLALSWLWLCGFLYHRHRATPVGFVLLAFPAFAVCYCGGFTGIPLFITIFVVIICGEFSISNCTRRAFNFLGDISYPLYLCHTVVMASCLWLGIRSILPMVMGSLLTSIILLYVVDLPFRRLLWRLWMPTASPRHHQAGRATQVLR